MIEWMLNNMRVMGYFGKLLDTSFVPGSPSNDTPLGKALKGMVTNYLGSSPTERGELRFMEYSKMNNLMTYFEIIKQHDLNLFESYKKLIQDAKTDNDFIGIRFEIEITAIFFINNYVFTMPDPPDFLICHNSHEISVECTSIQYHKTKLKDPFKKIGRVIYKKSKKHCNPNTALFIDITNIFFHHINHPKWTREKIEKYLSTQLEIRNFGSIVVVFHFMKSNQYQPRAFRKDNLSISQPLKEFLDKLLPKSEFDVSGRFPRIP